MDDNNNCINQDDEERPIEIHNCERLLYTTGEMLELGRCFTYKSKFRMKIQLKIQVKATIR